MKHGEWAVALGAVRDCKNGSQELYVKALFRCGYSDSLEERMRAVLEKNCPVHEGWSLHSVDMHFIRENEECS